MHDLVSYIIKKEYYPFTIVLFDIISPWAIERGIQGDARHQATGLYHSKPAGVILRFHIGNSSFFSLHNEPYESM